MLFRSGIVIGYLGSSREEVFMGEGATSVEARGPHTTWRRAGRDPPLTLVWITWLCRKNRSVAIRFVQFQEYFLNNFSKTKNNRKQATGTMASC